MWMLEKINHTITNMMNVHKISFFPNRYHELSYKSSRVLMKQIVDMGNRLCSVNRIWSLGHHWWSHKADLKPIVPSWKEENTLFLNVVCWRLLRMLLHDYHYMKILATFIKSKICQSGQKSSFQFLSPFYQK